MALPEFPPILVAVVSGTLGLVLLLLLLRVVMMAHEARSEGQGEAGRSAEPGESPAVPDALPVGESPEREPSPPSKAPTARQEPLVAEEVVPTLPEVHLRGASPAVHGKRLRLFQPRITLGGDRRDPKNDHVLDVPTISGTHAEFQIFPSGDVWVRDLKSSNGTRVNGAPVPVGKKAKLRHGDRVALGPDALFVVEGAARIDSVVGGVGSVTGGANHPLVKSTSGSDKSGSSDDRVAVTVSTSASGRAKTIIENSS